MDSLFWSRLHGGATHFPIALIFGAALFDGLDFICRRWQRRWQFKLVGYWLAIFAALSCFGAVFSGLALSKWKIGGTGLVWRHHLFVWPAFGLIVALGTWRFLVGYNISRPASAFYLGMMIIACALVSAAGFFGGEMLLGH